MTDPALEAPKNSLPVERLGVLASAFAQKGYTALTAVQQAVLAPDAEGRDLRITSQTGSGKTVAIGLVVRDHIEAKPSGPRPKVARPRALVITPTRELGRQVEEELGWLYAPIGARVVAVTGGTSYRDEHRALSSHPAVLVATPGRLLDHLEHGSLDPSAIAAVVLDEADRMLDMGFAESLEAILEKMPEGHRTHLVSATFPAEVRHLADRVQSQPLHLEGTRLGAANLDIEHVLVMVDPGQRLDALVNILLAHSDARTLVFTRTRVGVAEIAEALDEAGFAVASISGELAQRERTRALAAFKRGTLRILVATDVAARGIDVSDVGLVLHMEPPTDPDAYTHRSGRTGRAGKKGTSAVLVAPRELARTERVVSRANVRYRLVSVPTPAAIRVRQDDRIVERLTGSAEAEAPIDARSAALAERLASRGDVERTLARLLSESGMTQGPEPREVRPLELPRARGARPDRERTHRSAPTTELPPAMDGGEGAFVAFQISWGARHGADARRLLAMVCRRGEIASRDVGAIRIGPASSSVEVRANVAEHFAETAARPDPRDPRVRVRRMRVGGR